MRKDGRVSNRPVLVNRGAESFPSLFCWSKRDSFFFVWTKGGASSNFYTAFLVGDVDLSLMMTFLSTSFSFGTFPLWMWLSSKQQVDVGSLKYPWPNMVLSFVTLFLPTIIGTVVRRFRPALAHRIALFLHPIVFGESNIRFENFETSFCVVRRLKVTSFSF